MVRGGFTLPEEETVSPFRAALLIALASLLAVSAARSEEHAYITAEASGKVSIVDTHSDTVTSTFDVGAEALGMAASVDGARLYIAQQTGTFERDLFTNKSVRIADAAKALRSSPDGKLLAVVIGAGDAVALIDMPTLRTLKTISMHGRKNDRIAFSPDGRWLYAFADDGDRVDVIEVVRAVLLKSINVGRGPRAIAFLPDGTRAYVSLARSNEMVVIDVARHAVIARVRSTKTLGDVAAHPDGTRVFVTAPGAGSVQVLHTKSNRFVANVDVGASPSTTAFAAGGGKLYVACCHANEVSVIDTSTYHRRRSISVGGSPSGIVISDRPVLPRDGD